MGRSIHDPNRTGPADARALASLFFPGILPPVGALGHAGLLRALARSLDGAIEDRVWVAVLIGLVSAFVDNVPLVAARLDLYELPPGDSFWLLLADCAGTREAVRSSGLRRRDGVRPPAGRALPPQHCRKASNLALGA